ncbi:MAG: ABC transporter permease subunit [Chitinispirillaceae bacterium]|nr:ABC transporter permease subunit [Chitinispirillaceae bacterium]
MSPLRRIGIIIHSTISDELHHKSVYMLSGMAALFVLLLRGCFDNDVIVNGARLDGPTIGWHASLIAFHLIAGAGVIIGILLAMRVLKRDRENGTAAAILSKPVRRVEYLTAKTAGVWLLAYGLTFLLHLTVYFIMLFKTGGTIPLFMPASLLVSLNVLFMVVAVMLLSQLLPDIAAALLGGGIWLIGYISDTVYLASQNAMVKNVLEQMQHGDKPVALWRVLWPKMTALQYYAVSLIKDSAWYAAGPLQPVINVAGYLLLAFFVLWWHFSREEIR